MDLKQGAIVRAAVMIVMATKYAHHTNQQAAVGFLGSSLACESMHTVKTTLLRVHLLLTKGILTTSSSAYVQHICKAFELVPFEWV